MTRFALIALFLLHAPLANAELFETRDSSGGVVFSDRVSASDAPARRHNTAIRHLLDPAGLPGIWQARSADGRTTELTIRADGKFIFDQRDKNSPLRLFMCGTWTSGGEQLELDVQALKERLSNGETEQLNSPQNQSVPILSARRDRITLAINGENLTFDRTGS